MVLDQENLFSNSQAITATAVSENVIDLGVDRDIGKGEPIEVLVAVEVAATSGTSAATLTVELQTDDNESFSSPTVLASSEAYPVGDLVVGFQPFKIRVPRGTERYLRLNYTAGTENFTALTLKSGLILDRDDYRAYPSGYTVTGS